LNMISLVRAEEVLKEHGFSRLPPKSDFYSTEYALEVVIIAPYPEDELPTIFYIREGPFKDILAFKVIRPTELRVNDYGA